MKKWQNYSALSKVKVTLEGLAAETAANLEPLLDNPELIDGASEKLAGCAARLREVAGVLRALECGDLALLADEMLGLLREAAATEAAQDPEARIEKLQLLYVAAMDFPAVLEGVLSGRLGRWQEFSLLFNRIRKARNVALVFAPRTLLANGHIDFGRLAKANPGHIAALCAKQAALYEQAKKAFQSDAPLKDEVRALRKVFRNLEILYRDFRLGTLWGLCASLADALPDAPVDKGHPALKLLFSFSSLMQRVSREGAPLLGQNIPDEVLGRILDAVGAAENAGGRLDALKYWYNLDLKLCREHRIRYGDMTVGYSRKGAWIKAIRLLVNDMRLLAEEINLAVGERSVDATYAGKCVVTLRRLQGTAAALAIPDAAEALEACLMEHERVGAGEGQSPVEAIEPFLESAAQVLYRGEVALLARAEELERAVFSTAAGEGGALTGAKLNLVLEAMRNLQLVVNAIDAFAASREPHKLSESLDLLDETRTALAAVPLDKGAAYAAGCRDYIRGIREADGQGDEESFRDFVHLLLNAMLYLEQETLGRAFDLNKLLDESDALLERLASHVFEKAETGMEEIADPTSAPPSDGMLSVPVFSSPDESAEPDSTMVTDPPLVDLSQAVDDADAEPRQAGASVQPREEVDEEIKGFFLEEACEIMVEVEGHLAALGSDPEDRGALTDLRRAFHTLKGSGRMVEALAIGELAWSVENLLNQVLSGGVQLDAALLAVVAEVRGALPALVEDFAESRERAFDGVCVAPLIASVDAFLRPRQSETVEFPAQQPSAPAGENECREIAEGAEQQESEDTEESEERIQAREAREQFARIRRLLDDPRGVDAQGQTQSTTSFVIPVHTLRGICGAGPLAGVGQVAGRLENFLHDHPYEALSPELERLLGDFCGYAERALDGAGAGDDAVAAAMLDALARLDEPRAEPENDDPALLLHGFLHESLSTNALVLKLATEYRERPDAERALHLREQLNLFEGAARLADQEQVADLCHALSLAYRHLGQGKAALDAELADMLERCHGMLDKGMALLRQDEPVPDASDVILALKELLSAKTAQKLDREARDAEEQVEDSLATVFLEEADELLQEIDSNIADWKQAPGDSLLMDNLLRQLHTLKGSAALVGERELSECAHDFETVVIASRHNESGQDRAFFDDAEERLSRLQEIYAAYRRERVAMRTLGADAVLRAREADVGSRSERTEESDDQNAKEAEPEAQPSLTLVSQNSTLADADVRPGAVQPAAGQAQEGAPAEAPRVIPAVTATPAEGDNSAVLDEHVRVSSNLLKSLLNDANEISIAQTRIEQEMSEVNGILGDMDETLGRLQAYIRNFEQQAREKHVMSLRTVEEQEEESDFRKDFDALEMDRYTELQQISLSLLEDYDDLQDIRKNIAVRLKGVDTILMDQQRTTNKLQDGLISSQMVPFAGIVPRLRRLARQVSAELGKKVNISFSNPEGKMDRNVLQAIVTPLEHMIRNAIDHGVEPAAERARSGKPEEAEIGIKLYRQRANIILDVSDDGRGINVSSIRKKAIEKGLLASDARVSDQEAYRFIFRPGFSTSDSVSTISGRGVGMDVVNNEIRQVGGEIEVHSTPWAGTTFRVRLPLTSSLNRTLLFTVDEAEYVVLLNTIDGIMLEKADRLRKHYESGKTAVLEYGKKRYELVYMGTLLDPGAAPNFDRNPQSAPILLITGSERNIALQVDSIIGSKNLVVKSLGPQFTVIPGLSGGVILGDGKVVIVLDPISLADNFAVENGALIQTPQSKESMPEPAKGWRPTTVLVVDDSITVRKVTSAILKRNGMNVILAKNGMEAVEILQTETPDVMLLDIEMPKMDGFEVASYIRRQQNGLKDLPIIMITSRIGEKHRSRAEEIGVNEYMCKPFQEENLLAAIAGYH